MSAREEKVRFLLILISLEKWDRTDDPQGVEKWTWDAIENFLIRLHNDVACRKLILICFSFPVLYSSHSGKYGVTTRWEVWSPLTQRLEWG